MFSLGPDVFWFGISQSVFFFETILWIITIGVPISVILLWKKSFKLNNKIKTGLILILMMMIIFGILGAANIWIALVGGGGGAIVYSLDYWNLKWRRSICLVLVIGWCFSLYGSYVEPKKLVIKEFDLYIEDFPKSKIGLVADFHMGPYKQKEWMVKVVDAINSIQGLEGVLVPGDLVDGAATKYAKHLRPLEDLLVPVFLTLGNHDHAIDSKSNKTQSGAIRKALSKYSIPELENENILWQKKGITVIGVDDNDLGYHDIDRAFEGIDNKSPRILVAHSPDIIDELQTSKNPKLKNPKKQYFANLIVSGHTHCGQIRLPGYGALPMVIPTHNDKKYERYYYKVDDTHLFITCGTGEVGPRARLFNPPEIIVLNIN